LGTKCDRSSEGDENPSTSKRTRHEDSLSTTGGAMSHDTSPRIMELMERQRIAALQANTYQQQWLQKLIHRLTAKYREDEKEEQDNGLDRVQVCIEESDLDAMKLMEEAVTLFEFSEPPNNIFTVACKVNTHIYIILH
jgi:anion-transporting  ArsA/GET3 family ATPase